MLSDLVLNENIRKILAKGWIDIRYFVMKINYHDPETDYIYKEREGEGRGDHVENNIIEMRTTEKIVNKMERLLRKK